MPKDAENIIYKGYFLLMFPQWITLDNIFFDIPALLLSAAPKYEAINTVMTSCSVKVCW